MALPVQDQAKYWGIAAVVISVLLWALGDVLLPFVIGGAIAYFLDPVADRLEDMGCSRGLATTIITVVGVVFFVLVVLLVVPTLVRQASSLIEILPQLFQDLRTFLNTQFPSMFQEGTVLHNSLAQLGTTLQSRAGELFNTLLTSALSVINVIMLLVIAPVVAFYLLYDWDRMIARVDELLPLDHAPVVRKLASDIDKTLASFIRGMGTVCLVLGSYYAIALMLVGLSFGLVVGLVAGALTFIPYIGALVGGALAIGLALFQFWGDWVSIGLVAGIFVLGQVIEGNVLTPNLVGSSVGLHPVWLILALSVFGSLFGFVGMLVAVPVAAAIGVLIRFAVGNYKEGRLYKGHAGKNQE